MLITESEYGRFVDLLRQKTGISLGDNKQYLVTARLAGLIKEKSIESFSDLFVLLEGWQGEPLLQEIIDRMTTNETLWFRDAFPFPYLVNSILPEFRSLGKMDVSIWCAACSTGQEPYSISMAVEEAMKYKSQSLPSRVNILATDISERVLSQARNARYAALDINRGLSSDRQSEYFDRDSDGIFELKPTVKQRVTFESLNLMQMPYQHRGQFDVIFCRNVLIYFSSQLKQSVLQSMAECLKPGGYLFLGASEAMPSLINSFDMLRCNPGLVYRKR